MTKQFRFERVGFPSSDPIQLVLQGGGYCCLIASPRREPDYLDVSYPAIFQPDFPAMQMGSAIYGEFKLEDCSADEQITVSIRDTSGSFQVDVYPRKNQIELVDFDPYFIRFGLHVVREQLTIPGRLNVDCCACRYHFRFDVMRYINSFWNRIQQLFVGSHKGVFIAQPEVLRVQAVHKLAAYEWSNLRRYSK